MKNLFYFCAFIFALNVSYSCKSIKTNHKDAHTIFLVRHAEKGNDGTKDPPLNAEGIERAERLAKMLANKDIKKIYSTDYKRTNRTAEPLAKLLGLEVTIYNPSDKLFAEKVKNEMVDGCILIVGHSNTTPKLVNQIVGSSNFQQLKEDEYGNLFMITSDGKQLEAKVDQY